MTDEELAIFLRATFPIEGVGPITRAQRAAINAAADKLQAISQERTGGGLNKALPTNNEH